MTPHAWLALITYVTTVTTLGFFALHLTTRKQPAPDLSWAFCYLAGQALTLLLTLLTAVLPVSLSTTVSAATTAAAAALILSWRHPMQNHNLHNLARSFALALALTTLFPSAWLAIQSAPLTEWDARSIWFFHGKALFSDNRLTPDFFTNPAYAWSHLDYPLWISAQAAWLALFQGEWNECAAKAFLLFNLAAWLQLFFTFLRKAGQPLWLTLPAILLLFDHNNPGYVNGMADNHLAACLLSALLAFRLNTPATTAQGLFLLGFAASIKNEALPYLPVIAALWAGSLLHTARNTAPAHSRSHLLRLAALGFVPWLLWTAIKNHWQIHNDLQLLSQITNAHWLTDVLPARLPLVARSFAEHYAQPHILAPPAALLTFTLLRLALARRESYRILQLRPHETRSWLLFAASLGITFAVYLFTPRDLAWHIQTSMPRVLFFQDLLLGLMVLFACEPLARDSQSAK